MIRTFVAASLMALLASATAYSDPNTVDNGASQGQNQQTGASQDTDRPADAGKTSKAHARSARRRKAHARAVEAREGRPAAGLPPEGRASEGDNVDLTRPLRAAPIPKAPADAAATPETRIDAAPNEAEPDGLPREQHAAPTPAKIPDGRAALFETWLSKLKAALTLQPDQQSNWSDFETAVRQVANAAPAERKPHEDSERAAEEETADPARGGAGRQDQGAADLKALSEAAAPLYAGLDDTQRRVFRDMLQDYPHEHRERRRD